MLMIDRHFDGVFFDPNEGGSPVLYEHLSSIFLAGAYISLVVAAFGAISEILPTFSRQPQFWRPSRCSPGCRTWSRAPSPSASSTSR